MTPTNLKKASLTLAIGSALVTGPAFALAPTTTPDIELYVSGASAQDNNFGLLFADLCVAGTLDTFLDNADPAKPGAKHRAFFCTLDSSKVPGLGVTNPKVLLHKRSEGGSGMGVQPVADAAPIQHMAVNVGNCAETPAGSHKWLCDLTTGGALVNEVSDAGISDVEPRQFKGVNVPAGFTDITAAQLAKLKIQSPSALVFGVTVNTKLRNALQKAQGLTVGAETAANMPSLTKKQVADLMSNGPGEGANATAKTTSWSQFKVKGKALPSVAGVVKPADNKVRICRRVNGSGTQAQFNIKFLSNPCKTNSEDPAAKPAATVNLGSGSGDVEKCQADADAANLWSIGIQSTEKNVDNSKPYRYVKLDGKLPTINNAAEGHYFDWVEVAMQWLKSGADAPTGDKLAILNTLASNLGKPSLIATENTKFVYPWGQGGYLALPSNGYKPAKKGKFKVSNPVSLYSHSKGHPVNNCVVPVPWK
jgi:hypothetical protein